MSLGHAELRLVAQLADTGDPIDDGSISWLADRLQVELGSVKLTKQVEDSEAVQRKLIFDPTRLVDGIELSDDPLPLVMSAIYSIAYKQAPQSIAYRLRSCRSFRLRDRIVSLGVGCNQSPS